MRTAARHVLSRPLRATAVYIVAAAIWILLSDQLLSAINVGLSTSAATIKGLTFVVATGVMLYALLRRDATRLDAKHREFELLTHLARYSNDILILEDEDGRIVAVNDRAIDAYECTRDRLLGLRMECLRSEQSRADFEADLARLGKFATAVFEAEHCSFNGRRFNVEVSTRHVVIGGVRFVHSSIRDLSSHWREHEWLRLFVEAPFVGIAVTSPESKRWLRFNDELCRILGCSREQLNATTWTDITYPDDVDSDVGEYLRVLAGETEGYFLEKRFVRPDGSVVNTAIDVQCARKPDGTVDYFFATIQDVTEDRQIRAELRRSRDLYAMLSGTNASVVRASSEESLLQDSCRIAVETGGFIVAVAHLIDSQGNLTECASATAARLADKSVLSIAQLEAQKPVRQVLQSGQAYICNELAPSLLSRTWVGRVSIGGVRALAVQPIRRRGVVAGVLTLLADEPEYFQPDIRSTLGQVGESLSAAFDAMDARRAKLAAAKQLADTEIRLRSIIEVSSSAIWLADRQGRFLIANSSCAALLHCSPQELVGRSRHEVMDPVVAAEHAAHDKQVFDTRQPLRIDERLPTADGEVAFLTVKFPVYDAAGDLFAVGGIATDVTEMRRAADALRAANELWRSLIEASPAAICDVDLEGRVQTVWNPAAERLYGRPATLAIGQPLPIADRTQRFHLGALLRRALDCTAAGGIEAELQRPDGSLVQVNISAGPIRDAAGHTEALLCYVVDISERVRAQAALAASEKMYRLLFELHPAPMWVYDAATRRVLAVNDTAVETYGYARAEFEALLIDDLRPAEDLLRLIASIENDTADIQHADGWRHRYKDGTVIDVEIDSHSIEFQGHRSRLVMATDISERLRAERSLQLSEARLRALNQELEDRIEARTHELYLAKERAESSDRIKSLFLATVSHELRTPLNSIIGFSALLLNQTVGPLNAEQSKQLRILNSAGRHLLALISDFLDISKIEAGALTLNMVRLDLRQSVRAESAAHAPDASTRGLTLHVEECPEACFVIADPRRVRQVLGNLIANAIKFTDKGGISVSMELRPLEVSVSIRDTGIGIAQEHIPTLFAPFRRVETTGQSVRDGTGLGLAIARRLVEAMGGRIDVESVLGQGSCFRMTLPTA